jgi:hypothetical protein
MSADDTAPASEQTRRQRSKVPIDRWTARRNVSRGGVDQAVPMTLHRGIENDAVVYVQTEHDRLVVRDKTPWYDRAYMVPPGNGQVSWTKAGPVRPTLRMRNASYKREQGSSASRFPFVRSSPTGGLHTMGPSSAAVITAPRSRAVPQMRGPRINRLLPVAYTGQTYSQTTRIQGS